MESMENSDFNFKLNTEPNPAFLRLKVNNRSKDFTISSKKIKIKIHSIVLQETKYFQLFNNENFNFDEYIIKSNIDPVVISKVIDFNYTNEITGIKPSQFADLIVLLYTFQDTVIEPSFVKHLDDLNYYPIELLITSINEYMNTQKKEVHKILINSLQYYLDKEIENTELFMNLIHDGTQVLELIVNELLNLNINNNKIDKFIHKLLKIEYFNSNMHNEKNKGSINEKKYNT